MGFFVEDGNGNERNESSDVGKVWIISVVEDCVQGFPGKPSGGPGSGALRAEETLFVIEAEVGLEAAISMSIVPDEGGIRRS